LECVAWASGPETRFTPAATPSEASNPLASRPPIVDSPTSFQQFPFIEFLSNAANFLDSPSSSVSTGRPLLIFSPLSEWNTFRFVLHFTLTSFIVTATLPPRGLLQQLFHLPDSVFPSVASVLGLSASVFYQPAHGIVVVPIHYRMPRRCEYAYPLNFLNTLIIASFLHQSSFASC
jgi:hypothetical protein